MTYDRVTNWYLLTRTFLFIVKRLHRNTIKRFGKRFNGLVVDLGCGDQPYKRFLSCDTYVAVDIDFARRPMVVADAQSLPFREGIADGVLCLEVIEHVPTPERVIAEIYRILKPGGLLLLTAPMSWGLHYEPHDYWRFTPYGLCYLLQKHGFLVKEVVRIGGLVSLIGARVVEAVCLTMWRHWRFIPRRLRHGLLLLFSIPVSLTFALAGSFLDRFFSTDAIGHAVLATKLSKED